MELHRGTDGALSTRADPTDTASRDAHAADALALDAVSKRFGATVALRDATLRVRPQTVHALLGENGAGKSTLVHVAFGHVQPDAGRVLVDGREQHRSSPAAAIAAGLGMVHQHFALVPAMTVAENVALGRRGRYDLRREAREIARVGAATGLRVDPRAVVGELGVAAQQRVEIVKALVRGARVLMLDEPTAVLAPAEAAELLAWVRRFVDAGGAAVLITHKLREALGAADDVTVLRRGETVLHGRAAALDEGALLGAMVGLSGEVRGRLMEGAEAQGGRVEAGEVAGSVGARAGDEADAMLVADAAATATVAGAPPREEDAPASPDPHHHGNAGRTTQPPGPSRVRPGSVPFSTEPASQGETVAAEGTGAEKGTSLRWSGVGVRPGSVPGPSPPRPVLRLDHASYRDARGVLVLHDATLAVHAGELLGVAAVEGAGHHELLRLLAGRLEPTTGRVERPAEVGFVPEDRHRDALALDHSLTENVALRGAGRRRGRIAWRGEAERTGRLLDTHDVRAPGPAAPAWSLSGGNQQKLVLARELWGDPPALVAESPTRGLDVRAGAAVLERLRAAATRGAAVVVYSSDLDELVTLADRVAVVHAGRLFEVERTREAIGRAMVGA